MTCAQGRLFWLQGLDGEAHVRSIDIVGREVGIAGTELTAS